MDEMDVNKMSLQELQDALEMLKGRLESEKDLPDGERAAIESKIKEIQDKLDGLDKTESSAREAAKLPPKE